MSYHLSFLLNDSRGTANWDDQALRTLAEIPGVSVREADGSTRVFAYRRTDGSEVSVFFANGYLWAERIVDSAAITDLAMLANTIGAQLVGDEGETYMPDGNIVQAQPVSISQRAKWFARRNRFNIVLFASFAAVIVYLRFA